MKYAIVALVGLAGCVEDVGDDRPALGATAAPLQVCGGSLQAAIDAAPPDAVLELCAATYGERLVIDGKRLELRGVGAGATVIDAGGLGVALTVRGGAVVVVRELTLRAGRSTARGGAVACAASSLRIHDSVLAASRAVGGGGLAADGCALDVARTRFEGNVADASSGQGGGALVAGGSGIIVGCTFTGNDAYEGGGLAIVGGAVELADNDLVGNAAHRGGGLFLGGDGWVHGNRVVTNQGRWTAGGIYVDARTGTLEGNLIDGNTSVNDGAGVYVHQGAPVLRDNVITANVTGDDGGGVRLFESTARLERNVIERNRAADSGGGVRVSHRPALLVDNLIRANQASLGGGLDLDNDASTLRGGEVSGNRADDGGGLSIGLAPWLGPIIEDVRITDNVATGRGGGLFVFDNFKPATLRRLTVRGNQAATGGGLYVTGTDLALGNSVFDRNTASGDGGAIYLGAAGPTGVARLDFLTVHGNAAGRGSAVRAVSAVAVADSIVDDNAGVAISVETAPIYRYNDTWPARFGGMADPTGAAGNLAAPPGFVDAAAGDFRLASGSPAIDAGDPALRDRNGSRADLGWLAGPDGVDAPPPPPPPPPAGPTATLEADAHVAAGQPTTSFGAATTLASDTSPMTEAYLRFRVTGAGAGAITGARLRLTVTNPTGDAPTVRAAGSAWDEATLTWNGRPALGAVVADLGAVATGVIEYDVSSLVTGDGVYTLALIPTSTDGFAAWSREGTAPPTLVLTTGAPTPTAALEADGYVTAAAPTTSHDGATILLADGDPQAEAYLRFRVTGLTAPPTHARLRLVVADASSDSAALYLAASGWSEATLTWNTRPARTGPPLGDLGVTTLGQVVEYDVTSAITADGLYTFALIPTSTSGFGVASRETATPPTLLLD